MTKNITLAIEEVTLTEVRRIAARRNTTVNGIVREYLTRLASEDERLAETRAELKKLMAASNARLGPDYVWNREELYEERMFPRHERTDLRGDGEGG